MYVDTDVVMCRVTISDSNVADDRATMSWNLAALPDRFESTDTATVHQAEASTCFVDVDQSEPLAVNGL